MHGNQCGYKNSLERSHELLFVVFIFELSKKGTGPCTASVVPDAPRGHTEMVRLDVDRNMFGIQQA